MLNTSCRKCGIVGKSICDNCASKQVAIRDAARPRRANYDGAYATNRAKLMAYFQPGNSYCIICKQVIDDNPTAEHIVPLRLGGTHDLSNLGFAHAQCNYGWQRRTHR